MHKCLAPAPLQAQVPDCGSFPASSHVVRQRDQVAGFEASAMATVGVATFDPRPLVCEPSGCSGFLRPGVTRYADSNHLTKEATQAFVEPLKRAISEVLR